MQPLEWTKLMPYWTRNGCGVKVWDMEANQYMDRETFTFNCSSAPRRCKLAIAVRCAELAAIGIDKEEEGYEKDGHQIKILKHNANLALFLLANDQSVDQGSALADGNDQEES
ncbi:unnamed protein product [Durusdinium trenchii]|uniref:Uncharacterized protein n=2 Tax=Durusdinium trenchii TaxID=1381693 RepID=A0ABP0SZE4_9DINO